VMLGTRPTIRPPKYAVSTPDSDNVQLRNSIYRMVRAAAFSSAAVKRETIEKVLFSKARTMEVSRPCLNSTSSAIHLQTIGCVPGPRTTRRTGDE
jgi:hypothetical protein